MLDDVFWNAGAWIAEECGLTFGESEAIGFLSGLGALQPQGILSAPLSVSDDSSRAYGQIQYLPTGLAGGFVVPTATVSPVDVLQNTVAAVKPAYLDGCAWFMHRSTYSTLLQTKNTIGQPVILQSQSASVPESLLGFPIVRCDSMPAITGGASVIIFGNLKRAYTIVDRLQTRVLVDPFSSKPMVNYYCTRRVGGGLVNTEALKIIRVSAS